MNEEILKNILGTIQNTIEEKIDKKCDELIEEFKECLRIYKLRAISDMMSNVSVQLSQDIDHNTNFTITYKNIVNEDN